jgi:hypothetical protein
MSSKRKLAKDLAGRAKPPTIKVTRMTYSRCEIVTSVPFKCPLCGTEVVGKHVCSRPDGSPE